MNIRGSIVDTSPLRISRPFAALWAGGSLAALGAQIATVAVLAQMWSMTSSVLWTGMIGLATAAPFLLVAPLGGSLADRTDRRNLVRFATGLQLAAALALASQALLGNASPVLLLLLIACNSAATAFGGPARRAFPARLLPSSKLAAGFALQNLSFQAAMLVGPAFGGLLVGLGYPAAYGAQAICVLVAFGSLTFLPPMPPAPANTMVPVSPASARKGWRLALNSELLRGAFLTDITATVLAMPIAVLPMINAAHFGGDPRTLGLFLSAIAVGGLAAGVFSGRVAGARRLGRVMVAAVALWGAAVAVFGLTTSLWGGLLVLALAGAADTIAVIARGTLVQLNTPDHSRGRISAVEQVVGVAAPEVGNFRGGVLATVMSAPTSIVLGGLAAACAVTIVTLINREVWTYSRRDQQPARESATTADTTRSSTELN